MKERKLIDYKKLMNYIEEKKEKYSKEIDNFISGETEYDCCELSKAIGKLSAYQNIYIDLLTIPF